MDEIYTYEPLLEASQTRLLVVEEVLPTNANYLKCSLVVKALDELGPEKTQYIALSYTWDLPEGHVQASSDRVSPKYVLISGRKLLIRQNLFDALVTITSNGGGAIWADAIVINQADEREKHIQLRMISKIYQQATKVLVWLGTDINKEATKVQAAMSNFTLWCRRTPNNDRQIDKLRQEVFLHTDHSPWEICSAMVKQFSLPDWPRETWLALARFFHLRWFERLWCVQETVFGFMQNSIQFWYGSSIMSAAAINGVSLFLTRTGMHGVLTDLLTLNSPEAYDGEARKGVRVPRGLCQIEHFFLFAEGKTIAEIDKFIESMTTHEESRTSATILLGILLRSSSYKATYEEDKIYGILSLVDHFCEVLGLPKFTLDVAYGCSISHLFTETTRQVLLSGGSLGLLHLCNHLTETTTSLPSWVPNFSTCFGQPSLIGSYQNNSKNFIFNASKMSHQTHNFSVLGDRLTFQAVRFAKISMSGSDTKTLPEIFINSLRILEAMRPTYWNGQSRLECLWRTLTRDFIGGENPAPDSSFKYFMQALEFVTLIEGYESFQGPESERANSKDNFQNLLRMLAEAHNSTVDVIFPQRQEFIMGMVSNGPGRKLSTDGPYGYVMRNPWSVASYQYWDRHLFWTNEGYLGGGLPNQKLGDTLWIIPGTRTPFILRQDETAGENTYRLVGECYVHGAMHGEIVEGNDVQRETITLV